MRARLILLLFLLLFSGQSSNADEDTYKGLSNLTKVLDLIENNYIDNVNSSDLMESAIRGMLENLDPYSIYLRPEQFKNLEIDAYGEFNGIGVEVTDKHGQLTVVSTLENTPASRAGIKSGDIILSVDGKLTEGMVSYEVVKVLRGPAESKLSLTVLSPLSNETKTYKLIRENIKLESIKQKMLQYNIAYIKIIQFQKNSHEDFLRSYKLLSSESGNDLQGLIIDLRDNPGGLLDQAVEIADDFINDGLIVRVKGRNTEQSKDYYASSGKNIVPKKTFVLVNNGSASASEVLAGALRDNGIAKVLGEKTFGKGSVQTIIGLSDGSGVKITTAKFYTPNGSVINNIGITPDILVTNVNKQDRQLETAVNIMSKKD